MTDYDAIGICEGFVENPGKTQEDQNAVEIEAWQHLIDTELCWGLQGWVGRAARSLIQEGVCHEGPNNPRKSGIRDLEKQPDG